MARKKLTVVGAGNVGATTAMWLARKELGDIVLLDIVEGVPQGKALDMMQASPIEGFDSNIIGTNDYKETADSDVVIITAGLPRKPGMDRSDLIETNKNIIKSVVEEVVKYSPNTIILVVTNPLDVMVYIAWKYSGLAPERVMGLSGALDAGRMRAFIAMELGVSVEDVQAMVMGGHADEMVPLPEYSTVAGIPITKLLTKEKIDAINKRTRTAGGEIVALLKTGSAYYAPSRAVSEMAEAIIRDKKKIIPSACYLDGQYGVKGLFIGVPAVLGSGGVEKIIEIELDETAKAAFDTSEKSIRELVEGLDL